MVKYVQDEKYSTKSGAFLRLFTIFVAEISKNHDKHDKKDDYLLPAILIECRSRRTRNY